MWCLSHGVASLLLGVHVSPRYLSVSKRPVELKHAVFEALGWLLQSQTLSKKLENMKKIRFFFAFGGKDAMYPSFRQNFYSFAIKSTKCD